MNDINSLVLMPQGFVTRDVIRMTLAWESDHYRETPGFPEFRQNILRLHLIGEELSELSQATADNDPIKRLDALGDLDVVIAGTWLSLGLFPVREEVISITVPNWKKSEEWYLMRVLREFHSALAKLVIAYCDHDFSSAHVALSDLDYALAFGWAVYRMDDMREEVSAEILRSNLSKLDPATGKVLKSKAGRVLKGPGYSPPNLEDILRRRSFKLVA